MIKVIKHDYIDGPTIIFPKDILEYGWEKAHILGHLGQCVNSDASTPEKEDLYKFFKVFEKDKFEKLLQELIDDSILFEENRET